MIIVPKNSIIGNIHKYKENTQMSMFCGNGTENEGKLCIQL